MNEVYDLLAISSAISILLNHIDVFYLFLSNIYYLFQIIFFELLFLMQFQLHLQPIVCIMNNIVALFTTYFFGMSLPIFVRKR